MIDRIIGKIQKLQALAESANNEVEAATAAARVAELCRRHNLEIGTIRLEREQATATEGAARLQPKFPVWGGWIAMAVCDIFAVGWYRTEASEPTVDMFGRVIGVKRGASVRFFGLSASVTGAVITYEYLNASVEALLKGYIRHTPGITQKGMNDFRFGAAQRIRVEAGKLVAHRTQLNASSTEGQALMVIENRLVKQHAIALRLKTTKTRTRARDASHHAAGYAEGARVDLHGARRGRMLS